MTIERTLSIIKPDGVRRNLIGKIIARLEEEGLTVAAMKMLHMDLEKVEGFYAEHKGKPFYPTLIQYMSSGPSVVMVLEGENAIQRYREIMGPTDPAQAGPNTFRKLYALTTQQNTVHGSDAPETARREIAYFFRESEIVKR